jgi:carboxypeptidase Q
MKQHLTRITAAISLSLLSLHASAAGDPRTSNKSAKAESRGYDYDHPETQPATESLDLSMYARIREEGLTHSHIMEYASALFDGIGPRLTGSPNLAKAHAWTRDQLTAMGCANAHLEGWGDFGLGWRQLSTAVDMVTPDTAVFIAQATPWSPATQGTVTADVIAVPRLKKKKSSRRGRRNWQAKSSFMENRQR